MGGERADGVIKDALIVISAGSNDVIMNYYLVPLRRLQFGSVDGYHDFLLSTLRGFLQVLNYLRQLIYLDFDL